MSVSDQKQGWKALYPYESHYMTIGGFKYHYLDEGPTEPDGVERPVLICVHGNPTWSFFFRSVVNAFCDKYRVIAVDHIGCGLSEKPGAKEYPYTIARRADDLLELIEKLELKNCVLVAHDWGGAVGMCAATQIPDVFSKIVLMNTASYLHEGCPRRIRTFHIPILNKILAQGLNVFPVAASSMATAKGLSPDVKSGLLAPYDSWSNRVAVLEFVKDIPISPKHRSYETFVKMMERLPVFKDKPVALIWGVKDWCFPPEIFLEEYLKYYPDAFVRKIEDSGHYLLEDSPDEALAAMREFLER